jgi:hypothetical protein
MWLCLATAFGVFVIEYRSRLTCAVSFAALTLFLVWAAYRIGAGTLYWNPIQSGSTTQALVAPNVESQSLFARLLSTANLSVTRLRSARSGFEESGGRTTLEVRNGDGFWGDCKAIMIGMAALFVPISLLKTLSVVDLSGGRGLLVLTDIDTLFLDIFLLLIIMSVRIYWPVARSNLAYSVFACALGTTTVVLMAYVVTNYGTLLRLRLMGFVPIWMLLLALARNDDGASALDGLFEQRSGQSVFWRRTTPNSFRTSKSV